MFAHSEFEREVRSLQGAITSDPSFGERPSHQWDARERPERMAKLIKTHLGDDLQETEPIVKLLSDAIGPCDQRNFLAHGEWWSFFELAHKAGNGRGRQPERSRDGRKTLPLDDPD